jgi:hypothetical protein
LLCATTICAQESLAELPENPGTNKFYAKCILPDQYKDETLRVMICPDYDKLEVVPAEYKNEYQEVVIRPAKSRRTIDRYVLKVLKDDLNAIVEIGSYSDAQGSDQFNLTLSENRAKNLV